MNSEYLITFLTISFLVCLSPGPSMLFIIHQGLSMNWKNVVAGTSGLIAANIIWTTLCALGVGALMQSSQQVFIVLKYIGAMYLIYLGFNSIFSKNKTLCNRRTENSLKSYMSVFMKGFLTSMSNPKALLFYIAFLPQFLTGTYSYCHEIFLLGTLNISVIAVVMLSYGILSNKISNTMSSPKFNMFMDKILGISFVIFGVSLFRYRSS